MIGSLEVMSLTSVKSVLTFLTEIYDRYLIAMDRGQIPEEMSRVEYLGLYGNIYLESRFPGVDWSGLDDEWSAYRSSTKQ